MRMVSFHCDFAPRGKGRPRFGNGRTFTDAKTISFERAVGFCGRAAMQGDVMTCPVAITIYAHVAMPKSWPRKKREAMNGRPHCARPDADNIAKAIADALNGIVYADDAQIAAMSIEKRWLERDGFRVTVEEIA